MVSPLYLIALIHIFCLVIRKCFAGVFRAFAAGFHTFLLTAPFEWTLLAKCEHIIRSAAGTVELLQGDILSEFLLIESPGLFSQSIVVILCCEIGNTLCTVMTAITEICTLCFDY